MKLPVRNADGKQVKTLEVDELVFGIEPNMAVLHQAFVAQRANQRAGSASTKTRGEVQGSTRKIRMQKYTGRAREGGIRSPVRVGGGIAFGPRPRSYAKDLPKKMRRLAIRSALSGKLAGGQLVVIDQLALERPRTKEMMRILRNNGIERSVLVVTGAADRTVLASVRNLERTKALPAAYLNVVDMLNHGSLLMTEDAVRVAERLWGGKPAPQPAAPKKTSPGRTRAAGAAAPKPAARTEEEAPKPRTRKPKPAPAAKAPRRPAASKAAPGEEKKSARRPSAPKAERAPEAKPKRARRTPKTEAEA
jgi:large subunit ribosomal protein L4